VGQRNNGASSEAETVAKEGADHCRGLPTLSTAQEQGTQRGWVYDRFRRWLMLVVCSVMAQDPSVRHA